ncbi:MAG: peptidoglycan-binding protein, partial [Pseudomonadota bacterium]
MHVTKTLQKFLLRVGLASAMATSIGTPTKSANVSEFLEHQAVSWNNTVINVDPMAQFYAARSGQGIWTTNSGLTDAGTSLVKLINRARDDGLEDRDYLSNMPGLTEGLTEEALMGVELFLSQSFLAFGRDLHSGRTTPAVSEPDIIIPRKQLDPTQWLTFAAENGPAEAFRKLRPAHTQYAQLRQMLTGYRNLARLGGWPDISKGPTLKPGMTDPRVVELRNNLKGRGYDGLISQMPDLFDDGLKSVLMHFQKRHGLEVDGVAGPATIAALSHSVDYRIKQIVTNMERWRWLPENLGTRYVFVNQAAYNLHIRNNGKITDERKVIIGKEFHKTPMFSDNIRYAEFNPTWTVPASIAGRAILPKLKKDPGYLAANDYKLFTSWKAGAPAMSPYSIDWASVNPKRFPYRIVQSPGKKNALGQVKFMFPNK